MNPNQIIETAKTKLQAATAHFRDDLKKLRTGRANAAMLDGITVTAYGTPMPLIQVGTISVPEPQLLQITPFDPSNLQAIANAIRDNQSLGLNPMDDGRVVRVPVPPLTEERRKDFVKLLGGKVEDTMVSVRNIRHDAMKAIDQAKKDKAIGEDDASRLQKQLDDLMTQQKATIDAIAKDKEQEIMKV